MKVQKFVCFGCEIEGETMLNGDSFSTQCSVPNPSPCTEGYSGNDVPLRCATWSASVRESQVVLFREMRQ